MQESTLTPQPTLLARLPHYSLLLVKGPDASKFLQGQVTCDIRELNTPTSCLGAQCTAKGRVIFNFRALQMDTETLALRCPASMGDIALKSLGKYSVFSKVKLELADDNFQLFGLWGETAGAIAARFFTSTPEKINDWREHKGCYLIKLDENRYECWIAQNSFADFSHALNAAASAAEITTWTLLDIQNGIGDIVPDTSELFTPQELNLQLVKGVSFRKGCYTGQEIVARLHYRGKLKRHMYRFKLKTPDLPKPGTPVADANGHTCGQVIQAAFSTPGSCELLVSMLAEHQLRAYLNPQGEKLIPQQLPYAIPSADSTPE